MPRTLVFATHNAHKVGEVRRLLEGTGIEVQSLADVGFDDDPPETGDTFRANALQKARFVAARTGQPCIADDSGLEVDALDGAPGVHSKRYTREATAASNNAKLLEALQGRADRAARFRCVLAYVDGPHEATAKGSCEGHILGRPTGEGGFGYDPVFAPDEAPGRSMAQLTADEKNAISHRGRAFRQLPELLAAARRPARTSSAAHVDLYQLTSLVPHFLSGRCDQRVVMAFFSRRLPRNAAKDNARGYLLWAGLTRCLDHLERARFDDATIDALLAQPLLGPTLRTHPELVERMRSWRFRGTIRAPREGTPLFAGPARTLDGQQVDIDQVRPAAYCPYLEIETDLLTAKLIETPLLSIINHMTMVASKASRVVQSAARVGAGQVLEFGQRRTHPEAAVDAAVAAWVAGCAATSNVEAYVRHGVPVTGTMDHFAIQAWEQEGVPRHETEEAFFRAFHAQFPGRDTLLVDTYDTLGARTGIRAAVRATDGKGPAAIRLDSNITAEHIQQARDLLDDLGAAHTKIAVSGGMDEHSIAALGDAPVDGYGVGERIVTSPDAPVGVGAVAKLSLIDGQPTMKLSRSSGKGTLPGRLQVWRTQADGELFDVVAPLGVERSGVPLLETVWTEADGRLPTPSLSEAREHALAQVAALPEAMKALTPPPGPPPLFVDEALVSGIRACVDAALSAE